MYYILYFDPTRDPSEHRVVEWCTGAVLCTVLFLFIPCDSISGACTVQHAAAARRTATQTQRPQTEDRGRADSGLAEAVGCGPPGCGLWGTAHEHTRMPSQEQTRALTTTPQPDDDTHSVYPDRAESYTSNVVERVVCAL
jgi:hypothetical protein